jgi:hypothetical protein
MNDTVHTIHSPDGKHRVVIFRDDKTKTDQIVPFSAFDSEDPAMLWKFLEAYTDRTGGEVLAIPHNGNLSNGRMFALVDFDGRGLTRAYAETRARLEPVYEVTQMKGDGEAHPFLSPNDEFVGFELWDKGNLDLTEFKKPEMLQYEYARSGLKLGLKLQQELGVNPFKFGMIGSTDSHTSLATADQDNFFGKHQQKTWAVVLLWNEPVPRAEAAKWEGRSERDAPTCASPCFERPVSLPRFWLMSRACRDAVRPMASARSSRRS